MPPKVSTIIIVVVIISPQTQYYRFDSWFSKKAKKVGEVQAHRSNNEKWVFSKNTRVFPTDILHENEYNYIL